MFLVCSDCFLNLHDIVCFQTRPKSEGIFMFNKKETFISGWWRIARINIICFVKTFKTPRIPAKKKKILHSFFGIPDAFEGNSYDFLRTKHFAFPKEPIKTSRKVLTLRSQKTAGTIFRGSQLLEFMGCKFFELRTKLLKREQLVEGEQARCLSVTFILQ